MENSIKSLKEILRMDFLEIFENINGVEDILKQDPAGVYTKMDYKTKIYYRNAIKEIAEKTKISETYIAKKSLELAKIASLQKNINKKKTHIGYYLIGNGLKELGEKLEIKYSLTKNEELKAKHYIMLAIIVPFILTLVLSFYTYFKSKSVLTGIVICILSLIPITEIYIKFINYILGKAIKPKLIPKIDMSYGITEDLSTFVVIPTIIKEKEKVEEIIKKLEVYYIANKSKNIYLALLGDCTASSKENEPCDDEVIKAGFEAVEKLNRKYKKEGFPIFHFLYRKRKWNKSEETYLGWERKRGMLNEFNEYLLGNKESDFKINTIENWKEQVGVKNIPKIKYIITLDSDTSLPINSGLELVGAMAHILNEPVLDEENNIVIDGYGIMQPRVGIELDASRKSVFTKIYAGLGGIDNYTNAVSDVYQDNFGEGIFTGKGIYDLDIFSKVLKNAIPENTVLSHDLLEGCYLRCGLVSDILLLDGFPAKFNSHMSRTHRWIRGDWQIAKWLNKRIQNSQGKQITNPLNKLSKFKILDNLRRSLLHVNILLLIIISVLLKTVLQIPINIIIAISVISLTMPTILDIINLIVFKKEIGHEYIVAGKSFSKGINGLTASILTAVFEIMFLPYKAYVSLNAIIKTIYRMAITKKHMLEWMTAEEVEKQAKTDIVSYYKTMISNILVAVLFFLISIIFNNFFVSILGAFFLIGPATAWYISKQIKEKDKLKEISESDKEYLKDIAKRTWNFFKEYVNEENNFLPPDNYQENRNVKIARKNVSNQYWAWNVSSN